MVALCPTCDGETDDCPTCGGRGTFEFTGCPWRQLSPDVHLAVLAAKQAAHGTWPSGGGWLDEPDILVQAVQLIWSEESRWKEQIRREAETRH